MTVTFAVRKRQAGRKCEFEMRISNFEMRKCESRILKFRNSHFAFRISLLNVSLAVTLAIRRRAIARLCKLAVRTKTVLRVQAPKEAVIRRLNRRVVFSRNEHPLPSQTVAQFGVVCIKTLCFGSHL